jgi:hypothetical protein
MNGNLFKANDDRSKDMAANNNNNKDINTLLVLISGPCTGLLLSTSLLFLLLGRGSEFDLIGDKSPEAPWRLTGTGIVLLLTCFGAVLVGLIIISRSVRIFILYYADEILIATSVIALIAVGAVYAVLDMSFDISTSSICTSAALMIGFISSWPILLRRRRKTGQVLMAIGIYCAFLAWISAQKQIDWNMRRPFLRVYAQIQSGMTREEVQAIVCREFPSRRPVARHDIWGVHYTLDPNDGRFNSEFIILGTVNEKVSWKYYSYD